MCLFLIAVNLNNIEITFETGVTKYDKPLWANTLATQHAALRMTARTSWHMSRGFCLKERLVTPA